MSMKGWSVSGIGFTLWHDNTLKVIEFLENHKESIKATRIVADDFFDFSEAKKRLAEGDYVYEVEIIEDMEIDNLPDMIANVINHEEEILSVCGFGSCGETGTEENILYTRGYPWELSEVEKEFTKEDVEEIMLRYAEELGIDKKFVDDQEFEYYG